MERTILDLYRRDVDSPRPDHYRHLTTRGERSLSTREFLRHTAGLAGGLAQLGVGRGDRVLLLSENRPEWHITDLAVLDLGAADVPVYATLTPDQIAYQAHDCGAVVAVADGPEQMGKLLAVRDRCPQLAHLVQMDGERAPGVLSFAEVAASGGGGDAIDRFWERAAAVEAQDLATIIYTSGTTGEPKGVMLTHANLVSNVHAAAPRVPVNRSDLALEFLPLCHVLERMVSYIYMWRATDKAYCAVADVGEVLPRLKPTLFASVPRVFEKVHARILDRVAEAAPHRRALFQWALDIGLQVAHRRLAGREIGAALAARHGIAERLVLAKVRAGMGGRVRFAVSGGAELPLHVNEFFHALGLPIVEGYGLTETSPVIAVNGVAPGMTRLGTVGKPLENLEIRIADDGELLVRGPSVMQGYWNKPEQTAEVLDADSFLHTGDIAELDDDGFLLIVDRKKDLIVTAGGKNVAPQPIESQLKQSRYVDTAVLLGDRRPFIIALISPAVEELERWAAEQRLSSGSLEELVQHEAVRELYAGIVDGVNAGLARYEQIRRFLVIPAVLTVEGGQLTPTMKVKRRVIESQFSGAIDTLYASASS